jgi:hypothetical protein
MKTEKIDQKKLRAPFPYFGGKSIVAPRVWELLGPNLSRYVEPFAGSAAVLLARPPGFRGIEVLNAMAQLRKGGRVMSDEMSEDARKERLAALAKSGQELSKWQEKRKEFTPEEVAKRAYWAARRETDEIAAEISRRRCALADYEGVQRGGISGILWSPQNSRRPPSWPEYLRWEPELVASNARAKLEKKPELTWFAFWRMLLDAGVVPAKVA